jgi:hypothetical protein
MQFAFLVAGDCRYLVGLDDQLGFQLLNVSSACSAVP